MATVTTAYEVGQTVYALRVVSNLVKWEIVLGAIANIRIPDDVPTIKYDILGQEYDESLVFEDRAALVAYITANFPANT